MSLKYVIGGLLASAILSAPVFAQSPAPTAPAAATATTATTMSHNGQWRASKLIGVNVYNAQNEKLGDINEIIVDQSGKVSGVVVGFGGFLGMGEHDILVSLDKIKFVNEPVRTSQTTVDPARAPTTGAATNAPARAPRAANEKWYPDHAVMSATKDQLKSMQQFKYN